MQADRPLITAPEQIGWSTVEIPDAPAPTKVRVRTLVSLISAGTELRLYRGDEMVTEVWDSFADIDVATTDGMGVLPDYRVTGSNKPGPAQYPVSFGYNSVGEVIELGEGVTRLAIGDRVLCLARHQEVYDVRDWQAVSVPDEVTTEAAPFGYLPTLGLHALRRGGFIPGHNVAVIGLGLVGFGAALVADAVGARLVCLELNESRRERAAAALPDAIVLDPTAEGFAETLEKAFGYRGIDIVVEAGLGRGSLDTGMRILDEGGRLVAIALHPEDAGPLLASDFYNKQVSIVGTHNAPYEDPALRRTRFTMKSNTAYLFDLAASGRLALGAMHTDTYPAGAVAEAMADLASGERDMIGVLLDWR